MKTTSNTYTIIYSVVLVVIVAFLLAFVYTALKPMQDANVALDKKKQILNSLNMRNLPSDQAEQTYNQIIQKQEVGNKVYYKCKVGAEIKDNQIWQEKFIGKKIFNDGSFDIALGVKKVVKNPVSEVDAVTGATLTSNGVDAMLKDCLKAYNLPTIRTLANN